MTPIRPAPGSMPRIYADICNTLIDQGWGYVPRTVSGGKHKLIPPDPTKPQLSVSSTPSPSSLVVFVTKLRRCGAILDDATIEKIGRRNSRARLRQALRETRDAPVRVDPSIQPISTKGAPWRPAEPEPEPEPVPEPAPIVRPGPDHDARGTVYTLAQAKSLLMQGYHLRKVVAKTGWGRNWFADLVDASGYIRLKEDA